LPSKPPIVLAFDGSYNRDSTGLIGCTIEPQPHVFVIAAWERPEHRPADWRVPRREVDAAVDEAMETWQVREMPYDPFGWHREIEEWAEKWGDVVLIYKTNGARVMAENCSRFYSAVVTKELTHDGDPRLAQHLGNAVMKETQDGAYITKDGRNSPRKIDLAVGAVVALSRALAREVRQCRWSKTGKGSLGGIRDHPLPAALPQHVDSDGDAAPSTAHPRLPRLNETAASPVGDDRQAGRPARPSLGCAMSIASTGGWTRPAAQERRQTGERAGRRGRGEADPPTGWARGWAGSRPGRTPPGPRVSHPPSVKSSPRRAYRPQGYPRK
jgi:hypothetical protein